MAKKLIHISDKLQNILQKISSESWIAEVLLNQNINSELLVDNPVNYISISESDPTKISYISYNKLHKLYEQHKLSGRYRVNELFEVRGRVKIKFGSFVNKILKDVSPKDIEKFSSLMMSIMKKPNFDMVVVEGKDITRFYHAEYHSSNRGSLGISCMRHSHCRSYFKIYDKNPGTIKMLAMFNKDGLILARTLLWDLNEDNGTDFKFMDRIYTTNDNQVHHFIEWANKNGYAYKEKQSWNTPYRFKSDDKTFYKKMKIKLPEYDIIKCLFSNGGSGVPYLDTFKWVDMDGYLYNYKPDNDNKNVFTLVSTNGDIYGYNYLKEDEYNKEYWYESEVRWVKYLKMYICDRYMNYSYINNTFILKSHSKYHDFIEDTIFNEEYDCNNDKESINKLVELKKEEERLRIEKIKKDVFKTIPNFEKYIELANKFLKYETSDIPIEKPITDKKKSGNKLKSKWASFSTSYTSTSDRVALREIINSSRNI